MFVRADTYCKRDRRGDRAGDSNRRASTRAIKAPGQMGSGNGRVPRDRPRRRDDPRLSKSQCLTYARVHARLPRIIPGSNRYVIQGNRLRWLRGRPGCTAYGTEKPGHRATCDFGRCSLERVGVIPALAETTRNRTLNVPFEYRFFWVEIKKFE